MLYNETERELMASAIQVNMRRPNISPKPFQHIIADFCLPILPGARILDIGPGQCDFLDLARQGGAHTFGLDFDPAICALGRLRGHTMTQSNLQQGWPQELGSFDGIFCRGSINCHWFDSQPERLSRFLTGLGNALSPAGWFWIAPWNKPAPQADPKHTERITRAWLSECRISVIQPSTFSRRRYGIGYEIPRVELWQRGHQSTRMNRLMRTLTLRYGKKG